jgi:hypothetical protein
MDCILASNDLLPYFILLIIGQINNIISKAARCCIKKRFLEIFEIEEGKIALAG